MQVEPTVFHGTSDYRSALRNIAEERRSDTYRPLKPEHNSSANNIYINNKLVKCRIHILKQAPGYVTQLSNRKLTKRITKPNVLLYKLKDVLCGCHYRTRVTSVWSLPKENCEDLIEWQISVYIQLNPLWSFAGLTSSTHKQHAGHLCGFGATNGS